MQKKAFCLCLLACVLRLFLGRDRFHAVIADLIGFLPLSVRFQFTMFFKSLTLTRRLFINIVVPYGVHDM